MELPYIKFCRKGETDPLKQVADVVVGPLEYISISAEDITIG